MLVAEVLEVETPPCLLSYIRGREGISLIIVVGKLSLYEASSFKFGQGGSPDGLIPVTNSRNRKTWWVQ